MMTEQERMYHAYNEGDEARVVIGPRAFGDSEETHTLPKGAAITIMEDKGSFVTFYAWDILRKIGKEFIEPRQ